ncbi:MAG: four helix bundle protein [Candidatus Latescibacteria bacterium]|nr:four helix bundle protein [Candidatus Latescibacterota bacterium]
MNDKKSLKQEFRVRIYNYIIRLLKFLVRLPNDPVIREIKSQLTRSGTSIGANYFEASGASSKKDYQNFFSHALKSSNESKFWLAILKDAKFVPNNLVEESVYLLQEIKEIANIFASSILTMQGKKSF